MRQLRRTAKTFDEAKKELTKLQRQVDEDKHPKSAITVREAIEQWLDVAALEDTTRERYADLIRLYVLPTFGHLQAAKLDAKLLERFYARLHRCRDMCTGRPRAGHTCRPLSTSTTRKVQYIIRGALERAVRWRHLGVNKAAMAIAPSPERTEPDPPSADEAARLLNEAWSDPEWGLLLWLTMLTGPRRGEISALRWRHIDFERGLLFITRSNAQPKAGLKEKHTKTGQARKIALDAHKVELRRHHPQGLCGLGQRGRPPRRRHHGDHRSETRPSASCAARAVRGHRRVPARADPHRAAQARGSSPDNCRTRRRQHRRRRNGIAP